MSERALPHDLEAERAVLGAAILDEDLHDDALEALRGEDFYHPGHRLVWAAAGALRARSEPVETLSIRAELGDKLPAAGGDDALLALLDTIPSTGAVALAVGRVAQLARARRIIQAAQRIAAEGLRTPPEHVEAFADLAELRILDAGEDRAAAPSTVTMGEAAKRAAEDVIQRSRAPGIVFGAPTGLTRVDALLNGLSPGRTYVVAGRPGSGKSALALTVCIATARAGKQCALFSLEMSRGVLAQRALAIASGVDGWRIETGKLGHDDSDALRAASAELAELPIDIEDRRRLNIQNVRRIARRVQRQRGHLALIVIDYLQLLTPVERGRSREEEVSEVSRLAREIAGDLGCAVMVLAQLNRDVEKRGKGAKPMLSDLRESGSIEQDADVVIFVHRAELHGGGPETEGQAEIVIAKNRHGPTGVQIVRFDKATTRFNNLEGRYGP